ncbi:MAG TPA: cell division FtsA domain-containing protein [Candidatus Bathyarchaeia archaeon]|nr:cell division FtsA domain-containing protein [Candidatus Bathyarchaeia archaeon]
MGLFSKMMKRRSGDAYALSLDIGTEVVKALVFKIDEEAGKGVVAGVGRVRQKLGDMQSGAVSDIASVVVSCEKAIAAAEEMAGVRRVEQAIMGIAGELVKGSTTTVHYERLKPETRIDLPELKNIVQKVQWKAFDRIRQQLAWETGHSEIDVKLINAAIVDVRIDGYRVTNPLGFQGRDVSIGIFNAYAPMVHLGALQTIAEELDLELLSIAAEPYAVARSMGMENTMDFSTIFIDIGGGTTDIAVVRNSGLEGTRMFALGGRAFTKRLAQELNINFEEAEALKIRYGRGELNKEVASRLEKIFEEDCRVWLDGVDLSLSEYAESDLLPSRILLCGGGSALPGIKKILASPGWLKNLSFAKPPSVSFLQPKDVANIEDTTGLLRDPQDITPMGLANLALELVGEEKVLSAMLRRAVKMMQN